MVNVKLGVREIVVLIVVLFLLFAGVWVGYRIYPAQHPCPEITTDTVIVYDTIIHNIPDTIPYYIVKTDTIIYTDTVFKDIDTMAILKDYYAWHHYTRQWEDSLLSVELHDVVTQNRFGGNEFTYKILRPQTIITNVINNTRYSRYIIIGVDLPFKQVEHLNLNLDIMYVTDKYYFGTGYNTGLKCMTVKGGVNIFTFK